MREERIGLSQRERDRLRVLHEIAGRHLKQVKGAARLKLSVRQMRRLQRWWRVEGDGGLVHRARGRVSNRKIAEALRRRVLRKVGYSGLCFDISKLLKSGHFYFALTGKRRRNFCPKRGYKRRR